MISKSIFHAKIAEDTYLISTTKAGPNEDGKSLLPGKPTTNSYLIVGEEKAVLFDLAVNEAGVYEYAAQLAQKEVMLVLSHGHYDHVYHLNTCKEAWLHEADAFLIQKGMPQIGALPVIPCPKLYFLKNGEKIELGNRTLQVIHIPGHTPGSILLLDEKTKILFSGDTGARRLLLGVTGEVKAALLYEKLERLKQEDFEVMYSAHDRCAIPKKHLDLMLGVLRGEIESEHSEQHIPLVGTFVTYNYGQETELEHFNVAWLKKD